MSPSVALTKSSAVSGRNRGSRSSGPAITLSNKAVSRTVRAIGPTTPKPVQLLGLG
jgi:hypothetical protein